MTQEEILNRVKDMAKKENVYSEKLMNLAKKIKHPVLRALISAVASDSKKHYTLYNSVVELLTKVQPFISEENFKTISESIEKHIKVELKMMELTKELAEKVNDPRLKISSWPFMMMNKSIINYS